VLPLLIFSTAQNGFLCSQPQALPTQANFYLAVAAQQLIGRKTPPAKRVIGEQDALILKSNEPKKHL